MANIWAGLSRVRYSQHQGKAVGASKSDLVVTPHTSLISLIKNINPIKVINNMLLINHILPIVGVMCL